MDTQSTKQLENAGPRKSRRGTASGARPTPTQNTCSHKYPFIGYSLTMTASDTPSSPLIGRPAWQTRALCRGKGAEDFFLKRGETAKVWRIRGEICQPCPVRYDCLESAMLHDDKHGIWGGLGEPERDRIRRSLGLSVGLVAEGGHLTPELRERMIELVAAADVRVSKHMKHDSEDQEEDLAA